MAEEKGLSEEEVFKKAYDTGRMVQEKEHAGEHMDGQSIWKSLENQTGDLKDKDLSNND